MAEIFLWAELGGKAGSHAQLVQLERWYRDGRLLSAFGGKDRIEKLREVLQYRIDQGDLLIVLSSGYAAVIRPALEMVGLSDLLQPGLV